MVDKYRFDSDRMFFTNDVLTKSPNSISKKDSKKILKLNIKAMRKIQDKLFAERKHSFLFVFQAMDAAGKDGTIREVFSGINPQGIEITSFKKPTSEEIQHDFLWRIHKNTPQKGMIGVFNRSHYEEVLVTRVHPEYIVYQNLPAIKTVEDVTDEFWETRFDQINSFEKQLTNEGTTIIKFFLNLSQEEQERRLISRLNESKKHYKVNLTDFEERVHWENYMDCFQEMINNTATKECPWYVIPADDKNTMRALVSTKILEIMQSVEIQYPAYQGDFDKDKSLALGMLNREG